MGVIVGACCIMLEHVGVHEWNLLNSYNCAINNYAYIVKNEMLMIT